MRHTSVLPERVFGRLCGQLVVGGLASVLPRSRQQGIEPRTLDGTAKAALIFIKPLAVLGTADTLTAATALGAVSACTVTGCWQSVLTFRGG